MDNTDNLHPGHTLKPAPLSLESLNYDILLIIRESLTQHELAGLCRVSKLLRRKVERMLCAKPSLYSVPDSIYTQSSRQTFLLVDTSTL